MELFLVQKVDFPPLAAGRTAGPAAHFPELKTELIRKSIHFLIAFCPLLATANRTFTVLFLAAGTLGYAVMERLRLSGVKVPLVSSLTAAASRSRDVGRFVMGPVTLGLGALFALLLFPSPAAAIAIYALAFGDGIASLAGKFCGKTRPAFLHGKSVEGSLACFGAVFVVSYNVSRNFNAALIAALTAAAMEALPLEDWDNVVIPVAVGLTVHLALF